MLEEWKPIPNFEDGYLVSNLGRIKSLKKWKRASCPDEYILKSAIANNGYCQVTLYNGTLRKKFLIHRLVAEAFIPNPDNLPQVNHIDENPQNNRVDNLEWCTPLYNNCYGTAKFRAMITRGSPVVQKLINGQILAKYVTSTVAQEITGISRADITACIRGELQSAGGFIWERG